MFQEVGDKPYENSGFDYFSEIFSDPGVPGHARYPPQNKTQMFCVLHPFHKEGSIEPTKPL